MKIIDINTINSIKADLEKGKRTMYRIRYQMAFDGA